MNQTHTLATVCTQLGCGGEAQPAFTVSGTNYCYTYPPRCQPSQAQTCMCTVIGCGGAEAAAGAAQPGPIGPTGFQGCFPPTHIPGCGYTQTWGHCPTHLPGCGYTQIWGHCPPLLSAPPCPSVACNFPGGGGGQEFAAAQGNVSTPPNCPTVQQCPHTWNCPQQGGGPIENMPIPTRWAGCPTQPITQCWCPPQGHFVSAPPNCPTVQQCPPTWNCGPQEAQPLSAPPCPTVQQCHPTWNCPPLSAPPCPTVQQCHPQITVISAPPCPTVQQCPHTWNCPRPIFSAPPNCPTVQECPPTWNCGGGGGGQVGAAMAQPLSAPPHCPTVQQCPPTWHCPPPLSAPPHCPTVQQCASAVDACPTRICGGVGAAAPQAAAVPTLPTPPCTQLCPTTGCPTIGPCTHLCSPTGGIPCTTLCPTMPSVSPTCSNPCQ